MAEKTDDKSSLLPHPGVSGSTATFKFNPLQRYDKASEKYERQCVALPPPRSFWPILALIVQPIMLGFTIWFIIWSSKDYRVVPTSLTNFILDNPKTTTTAFTLMGSTLSLVTTKFFAEAIRFTINVTMGNPKSDGVSLYSLYAATIVASKSPLLNLSSDRKIICWTAVSIISFVVFTVQTAAWTTLFTPTIFPIPSSGTFLDINLSEPLPNGVLNNTLWTRNQMQTIMSGIVPGRRSVNLTDSFVHKGFQLNSTTWGILPFPDPYQGPYPAWTQINARQQGFTAEVSCEARTDLNFPIQQQVLALNGNYVKFYLCCNCTSNDGSGAGPPIVLFSGIDVYIAVTICPYQNSIEQQDMTFYTFASWKYANKTCTIKPQMLDVNVTYNYGVPNGGTITIQPLIDSLVNLPLNSSVLGSMVENLKNSFYFTQSATTNVLVAGMVDIINELALETDNLDYDQISNQLFENYIRGTLEFSATLAREMLSQQNKNKTFTYNSLLEVQSSTQLMTAFIWGHIAMHRLPTVISPLIIMSTTIIIVLYAFFRFGMAGDLKHVMYFDPMDVLHVVAACRSSNVHELEFPDYKQDIGVYGGKVKIGLRKRDRQVW